MRQLLPQLPILPPVRVLVLLELHLIHYVSNLLSAAEELNNRAAIEAIPPLFVLLDLLLGRVFLLNYERVLGDDAFHLRRVPVVRAVLALPP